MAGRRAGGSMAEHGGGRGPATNEGSHCEPHGEPAHRRATANRHLYDAWTPYGPSARMIGNLDTSTPPCVAPCLPSGRSPLLLLCCRFVSYISLAFGGELLLHMLNATVILTILAYQATKVGLPATA